ncbi:MAG: YihY family inner membrane protein, partial [Deltaproteobacteria bacterium]
GAASGGDAAGEPRRRRRSTLRGVAVSAGDAAVGLRQRAARWLAALLAHEPRRRRGSVLLYALRVAVQVFRQWARDRCPQQAASLAFQTVLSIVPTLALALSALRATGNIGAESTLVEFMSQTFIPVSPKDIAETLTRWSENVTFKTLGVAGLVLTLAVAFVMFNTLDRVMNDIWRTERRRPLAQKLVVFYAAITVLPLAAGLTLLKAQQAGLTDGFAGLLLGFGVSTAAAFTAIYVLPRTRVHLRAALAGSLVFAVLFEIAKALFKAYATEVAFAKYAGIYGAVAIVPILLLWIYYSWLVLLLGCEVAFAAQHLHLLERGDRRRRMSLERELLERVNGVVASRVMVAIAEAYLTGRKAISRRAIADRFDLSDEVVDRIVQRLKEADLVFEVEGDLVGLMPARPPSEIALADVLAAFRSDDVSDARPGRVTTRLDRVLREIDSDVRQKTGTLTLDQLVDR